MQVNAKSDQYILTIRYILKEYQELFRKIGKRQYHMNLLTIIKVYLAIFEIACLDLIGLVFYCDWEKESKWNLLQDK